LLAKTGRGKRECSIDVSPSGKSVEYIQDTNHNDNKDDKVAFSIDSDNVLRNETIIINHPSAIKAYFPLNTAYLKKKNYRRGKRAFYSSRFGMFITKT
jgi:hypothetical protein